MSEHSSGKTKIRFSDIAIRVIAYGVPITIGFIGFRARLVGETGDRRLENPQPRPHPQARSTSTPQRSTGHMPPRSPPRLSDNRPAFIVAMAPDTSQQTIQPTSSKTREVGGRRLPSAAPTDTCAACRKRPAHAHK